MTCVRGTLSPWYGLTSLTPNATRCLNIAKGGMEKWICSCYQSKVLQGAKWHGRQENRLQSEIRKCIQHIILCWTRIPQRGRPFAGRKMWHLITFETRWTTAGNGLKDRWPSTHGGEHSKIIQYRGTPFPGRKMEHWNTKKACAHGIKENEYQRKYQIGPVVGADSVFGCRTR